MDTKLNNKAIANENKPAGKKQLEQSQNHQGAVKLREKVVELEEAQKALINILEDVDETRKKAEEEKNKTQAIITNFADALLVFDKEHKLSLINPLVEKLFDIKSKDIAGKSVGELVVFPSLKPLIAILGESIRSFSKKEIMLGKSQTFEVSVVNMMVGEERMGHLVILHDITREKTIEKMKTEFVSLTAHQLRTPLSAVKWTLRMLLDGDLGQISQDQKEYIEKTYRSNERMISLINDLLDVTRIEEGRYVSKPAIVQFEDMVQGVVSAYKEEAERRKIKLEFNTPVKKLPKIAVDVEKIKLVIQNLLDNAIRYTPPGGKVTVSLKSGTKEVECSVKDTGIGIPKSQQTRIFTKFFRAANVLRTDTEGTGLGLFITKNIVEAHEGKIWFESEENKGTSFHITLPVKEEFEEFFKRF